MLSRILILVIISVISPAKSTIVEFKLSDFAPDFNILREYYTKGGGKSDRAYIDIPNATIAVKPVKLPEGGLILALEGTFTECICRPTHFPWLHDERNSPPYNNIFAHRNGEFYTYPKADGFETVYAEPVKIEADTRLRYDYHKEIKKEPPYVAIKYAGLEEIQKEIDDVFQDVDINKKYYTQPTYVISQGPDGHFLQFVESSSSPPISIEQDLDIRVLIGSISTDDSVVTITRSTTKPFLLHDMYSKKPLKHIEGALGIRMDNIGVLAKRFNENEVSVFTLDVSRKE